MTQARQIVEELITWYTTREAYSAPSLGFFAAANMPNNREVQQDFQELEAYLSVIESLDKRGICVEIGFNRGGTHFAWRKLFDEVISIDINYWACCKAVVDFPERQSKIICGDSKAAVTVQTLERVLEGRTIDHLFIDGDHEYTAVLADFLAYAPLVRSGGLVGFHDSYWPQGGVIHFISDLKSGRVAGWEVTQVNDIKFSQGDWAMGISYFYKS